MAKSVNPDLTANRVADLIWVYIICWSKLIFRVNTVEGNRFLMNLETVKILIVYPCILKSDIFQWCSQNAEKVTHIKGRLLDQAMILFNYVPFQNGNFS